MSLTYPDCPVHGPDGTEAENVARAYTTKGGQTDSLEPRQRWKCKFWLKDGSKGDHKFTEGLSHTIKKGAVCDDCGAPVPEWKGGQPVFKGYVYKLKDICEALVLLAGGGMEASYRAVARHLRKTLGVSVKVADSRRIKRRETIDRLMASGSPKDRAKAHRMARRRPYREHSDEPNITEGHVEACAEVLTEELAPKRWPAGSIVAVDSVKMNLSGTYKYMVAGTDEPWDVEVLDDNEVPEIDPDEYDEITQPAVQVAKRTLDELYDSDEEDDEEGAETPPELTLLQGGLGAERKGLRGGVPCWQVLGAYTYEPNELGEFDASPDAGTPWLLRAYYMPSSIDWAHFFRQLPGTPGWIICDGAPEIRVGIELAWPDEATRPKIIACEYHVTEAIRSAVEGHPELEVEALRLFNTYGRIVDGEYEDYAPNGEPGDELRLWHFRQFRKLAEEAGFTKLVARMESPTWKRFEQQVLWKDGKLKYSIGALEAILLKVGTALEERRMVLTNRPRTNSLLALMLLALRGDATIEKFSKAINHRIRHGGSLKRHQSLVDRGIGSPSRKRAAKPSLRRPLNDEELQNPRPLIAGELPEEVALPTWADYWVWKAGRRRKLKTARERERYHAEPDFRAKELQRRQEYRETHRETDRETQRSWYVANQEKERQSALERKARRKGEDPEGFAAQHREQSARNYARNKKIGQLMKEFGVAKKEARELLEAAAWDVETAAARLRGTAIKEEAG